VFSRRNPLESTCGKWQGYLYALPSATLDVISKNAAFFAKFKYEEVF
jgi:hypothetical protein